MWSSEIQYLDFMIRKADVPPVRPKRSGQGVLVVGPCRRRLTDSGGGGAERAAVASRPTIKGATYKPRIRVLAATSAAGESMA